LATDTVHTDDIPDDWVVSHEELAARRTDATLTVVDALPRASWEQGHIPGAVSLPLAEIPDRAADVLPDRDADLAVYCASFT